ncbi:MAG: FAD-dependent oxidoreductase [Cyclobacteriaceae bacterium]
MKLFITHCQRTLLALCTIILFSISCENKQPSDPNTLQADVIVYGGTSAAVTTAVQASRMGKSVIVVSPDKHLGGLSAGGLGWTDSGKKQAVGGISREFYQKIFEYYDADENWKWQKKSDYGNKGQGSPAIDGNNRTMWIFEPHIAEQVFEDFIKEHKIKVYRDEWLNRESGVEVSEGQIKSITTLSGKKYEGKMFVDATYEGDLMASSGVSYHVGREANSVYDETWNGVQIGTLHHKHWFMSDISPYKIPGDSTSGVLPLISTEDPGVKGEGDHRIQAYCFRVCMTNHPENRKPFPKPTNYDRARYELLTRVYATGRRDHFEKFDPIPNKKTDTNNHGPVSSDYIGMNYDYPEASYERRKEIIADHQNYQQGLLYFICNDPSIPEDIQSEYKKWGLAKDEFVDNDNWPHQLYVREARRMIGEYVTSEKDITSEYDTPQSVGMGSYAMDSHNTQRYIKPDGFVQNEGDIGTKVKKPYKISYGSIIPRKEDCRNLLVPVCVSSSHIAYGSIRMEPVFMILGQSAGTAAAMALDENVGIHDLPFEKIRAKLLEDGQVLELPDM